MSRRLSIVIISYNTRDYLCRCLATIEEHAPPFSFETIVVDNASTDGSVEAVGERFPWARVLPNHQNRGYSAACNLGIRAGDSEHVLLLNSDTEMLPGTLAGLVEAIEARPRAGAVAPLFVDGQGEVIQMSWGWRPLFWGEIIQRFFAPHELARHAWRRPIVHRLQRHERTAEILCGAAILFRRTALEAIGGMDEDYVFYLEDSDVCARLWKAGWEVVFTPRCRIVHHLGKASTERRDRIALIYRQSQLLFYRKHGTALDRLLVGIYLRLKFWRMYWPAADGDAAEFHRQLRGLIENRVRIDLV